MPCVLTFHVLNYCRDRYLKNSIILPYVFTILIFFYMYINLTIYHRAFLTYYSLFLLVLLRILFGLSIYVLIHLRFFSFISAPIFNCTNMGAYYYNALLLILQLFVYFANYINCA